MAQTDAVITIRVSELEEVKEALAVGVAAINELKLLKPILALAISRAPKQQLKLSLTDQTRLSDWDIQAKQESKSGAIVFRAVKA